MGLRFGKLTILRKTENRYNRNIIWECVCDCGNITEATTKALNSNEKKSCGCLTVERSRERFNDVTGQRFNKLIVIKRIDDINNERILWECLCDCGNIIKTRSDSLISGHTKSCGCIKSIGEYNISKILQENSILFKKEYSFIDLLSDNNVNLRFDFGIINNNNELQYLIEFDGKQHYISDNSGWNDEDYTKKLQEHDRLKNEYCLKNNIRLIRIPYTHRDNISLDMLIPETSSYLLRLIDNLR